MTRMCIILPWVGSVADHIRVLTHCVVVLHPGLKLQYFRMQNWEKEWVEAAENLTREEYLDHYKDMVSPPCTHENATNKKVLRLLFPHLADSQ